MVQINAFDKNEDTTMSLREPDHEDTLIRIATMAAESAVEKTFLALGVDISTPAAKIEMQERFSFLGSLKHDLRTFKTRVIQVIGGALTLIGLSAIYQMLRGGQTPPGI